MVILIRGSASSCKDLGLRTRDDLKQMCMELCQFKYELVETHLDSLYRKRYVGTFNGVFALIIVFRTHK